MAAFDAVLFDLDGTLCHPDRDTEALYAAAFERAGVEPFGDPPSLWAALEGPPDHDDWPGYIGAGFARLAAQYGRTDVDPIALAEALEAGVDDTAVSLAAGAARALDSAADLGPVGLVTNGPETRQRAKLEALDVAHRFDAVVYAADLPRKKPHAAPFERALTDLDTSPERALYVGNSPKYDVAGAQNAGLPVAWLRGPDGDPGPYDPEYVIDSLADLPDILVER
ncbi:HAD family hydrolase [Natrinema salinisoli]|uniref:HAD family hydrolase n=1 Tax=Natrinema salinisoli TaxID=2878535 RepID=UPI001CF09C4E|nr:HAD family hydrolase [Natrinema salinisoli]